jgi:hypothetical protein
MGDAAHIAEGISHAFDWTHVGVTKGMVAVLLISLAAHLLIPLRLMYVSAVLLVLSIPTTPFRAVTDIIQVSGMLVRVCIVPAPPPEGSSQHCGAPSRRFSCRECSATVLARSPRPAALLPPRATCRKRCPPTPK